MTADINATTEVNELKLLTFIIRFFSHYVFIATFY